MVISLRIIQPQLFVPQHSTHRPEKTHKLPADDPRLHHVAEDIFRQFNPIPGFFR
jgi:hypothetical protein